MVLSERPGLVGHDQINRAERLLGVQSTDEGSSLQEPIRPKPRMTARSTGGSSGIAAIADEMPATTFSPSEWPRRNPIPLVKAMSAIATTRRTGPVPRLGRAQTYTGVHPETGGHSRRIEGVGRTIPPPSVAGVGHGCHALFKNERRP